MRLKGWTFWDFARFSADAGGAGGGDGGAGGAAAGGDGGGGKGAAADGGAAKGADGRPDNKLAAAAADVLKNAGVGKPNGAAGDPPAAGTPYHPDGLAETYKGKTDRETIDALAKAVGAREGPPAKPDDYALELPADFVKKYGDLNDDPVLPIAREVLHKHGVSQKEFSGIFNDLYAAMAEKGVLEPAIDPYEVMDKLAPKSGDPNRRKAEGAQRITGALDSVDRLVTRGELTRTEGNILMAGGVTAEGIMLIEKIAKRYGEHGVQVGGASAPSAGYTKADWQREMADERYSTRSPKYDPDYRKRVDEAGERLLNGRA